jgi:hypothetical protein
MWRCHSGIVIGQGIDIGNSLLQPISNSDADSVSAVGLFSNLQGNSLFVDQDSVCKNSLRGRLLAGCGVCAELYGCTRPFAAKGDAKNVSDKKLN